jgi:hypothetical protein
LLKADHGLEGNMDATFDKFDDLLFRSILEQFVEDGVILM